MKQIFYAMEFSGQAAPVAGSSNVIKAATSASSCSLTSTVGADGLSASLKPAAGGKAIFESEVTVTGDTSFVESGTIRFGEGNHRLRFSTVGEGYMDASADPKLRHGSVIWRIDGGEGQFAGASGLITSNFTLGETGAVIDRHFGVIFVR
jgi:hypothetical protein